MGATTIEKILARTSGKDVVRPGEVAVCRPDIVLHIDLPMAIEGAWYRPKKIFDPDRVAMIFDHAVPSPTIKDASAMSEGRRMAKEFGLKRVFDVGRHGISHVVAAENGLARPGELLVCADSHTCASGGLNCAGRGAGIPDTLQAMTKGIVWYPVTPTIRYEFKGRLNPMVSGKDVFFHIAQTQGGHGNTSIEYGGPGLAALAVSDRRTIATMSAEIGAEFALFDYDELTAEYLIDSKVWAVGSPTTVAELIREQYALAGGFGTLLMLGSDYADPGECEKWFRSMELLSTEVLPRLGDLQNGS